VQPHASLLQRAHLKAILSSQRHCWSRLSGGGPAGHGQSSRGSIHAQLRGRGSRSTHTSFPPIPMLIIVPFLIPDSQFPISAPNLPFLIPDSRPLPYDTDGLLVAGQGQDGKSSSNQGLTLLHFSAQRKRFLRDRGCVLGLCRGCFEGGRGY
jgi:hypothetical protein